MRSISCTGFIVVLGLPGLFLGGSGCRAQQQKAVAQAATASRVAATAPSVAGGLATPESQIASGRASLLDQIRNAPDKKNIMRSVSQAIGERCDYCHDVSDFSATTVNKKIAGHMFSRFGLELQWKDGSVVGCQSCHQGQAKFLGDRSDKDRIRQLMKTRFVDRLTRKGGGAVTCITCHGATKDQPFLPRS